MRSPSDNLLQLISELELCDAKDVAGCEATVRRLCRDLPDFDSVWIDALTQRRIITPWQAGVLQSNAPHRLRVDRYVLTKQLGNNTFLGREIGSRNMVAVRRLGDESAESTGDCGRRLAALIQRTENARGSAPVTIALPLELAEPESSSVPSVVSEFIPGWNAEELLIRGGRLPWPVVAEIGQQLLTALAWLESQELHHGEIVLQNIRLRPSGRTVLVAPFAARQQQPFTSFAESLTLRDIATLAPELVATGNSPDSRSEIYAVGCVLWQLLTSRPVFPSADPVTRLTQAKADDVEDVRSLVPDCPDWMARAIHNFTRRSRDLRTHSLGTASTHWASHAGVSCKATRKLCHRLPDYQQVSRAVTSGEYASARVRGIGTVVASILMVCAFISYGMHRGLLPTPLIMSRGSATNNSSPPAESSADPQTDASQPNGDGAYVLPQPDPAGVVVLKSGRSYRAADLAFAGVMHVETSSNIPASVVIEPDSPWHIEASQVILNNVQLLMRMPDTGETRAQAALVTTCNVLSMTGCLVDIPASNAAGSCIYWSPATGVTNVVSMKNCVFSGGVYGMTLSTVPERCSMTNMLFLNSGAALRCNLTTTGSTSPRLTLSQVTQTLGHGFLDIVATTPTVRTVDVQIQCGESVLAPDSALVRIALPAGSDSKNMKAEFLLPERGNPTVVPPSIDPVVYFDRSLNQMVRLAETQIVAESLLIAEPVFRGASENATHFERFELLDFEGPKLSPKMPGINPISLPKVIEPTINRFRQNDH
ncbi:MAG: hypothetical protein GY826_05580 [Fuerstiella sp.]|nr:hypothetical protein [Fuerstiella sp.]